jgi:hypothetical protein
VFWIRFFLSPLFLGFHFTWRALVVNVCLLWGPIDPLALTRSG